MHGSAGRVFEILRQRKKKFATDFDLCRGSLAEWGTIKRHHPAPYAVAFGFWLNRHRTEHQLAHAVAIGTGIVNGTIEVGDAFYESVTDGRDQAIVLKGQFQQLTNGGSDQ